MNSSLSLSPGAEAKLVERAAAADEDLTTFAARLLERAISDNLAAGPPPAGAPAGDTAGPPAGPDIAEASDVREFDAVLDELFGADVRQLPDATLGYSREDIYFDHD